MLKWCLNLKLLSSSSYHALKTTSFKHLPSGRTLRDYTNYIKAQSGIQDESDENLKRSKFTGTSRLEETCSCVD